MSDTEVLLFVRSLQCKHLVRETQSVFHERKDFAVFFVFLFQEKGKIKPGKEARVLFRTLLDCLVGK